MADRPTITDRRMFLGLAAAAASVPVAQAASAAARDPVAASDRSAANTYHETAHVRTAYDRMRF